MAAVPTAPAAISAALTARDGGARLQVAEAILDRLEQIADRDANRVLFASCDAVLDALPQKDTSTLDRWLTSRHAESRPSLYVRARLSQAAGQLSAAAEHWDALFRGTPTTDVNVLLQYARVLADVGRFSEAAERLRQALRGRPRGLVLPACAGAAGPTLARVSSLASPGSRRGHRFEHHQHRRTGAACAVFPRWGARRVLRRAYGAYRRRFSIARAASIASNRVSRSC